MAQERQGHKKNGDKLPTRTRNFATVVYPTRRQYEEYYSKHSTYKDEETGEVITIPKYDGSEGWGNTPDNWIDIVRSWLVTALISPMHLADTNPDGSIKKPHWHVMLMFDGVKNFETQVKPLFDQINAVGRENVNSARGYARYLCHMDNPEKHRYSEQDVTCIGGADFKTIIELPGDKLKQYNQLIDFIERNDIISYAALVQTLRVIQPDLEYVAVFEMTYPLTQYIRSRYWIRNQNATEQTTNQEEDV